MIISHKIVCRFPKVIYQSKGILSSHQIRNLFSAEELGIKKYEESRKVVEHAIANHIFFKQQFRKQLLNVEYSLTQLEYGLKNLLHIMGNNENDVRLLQNALKTLLHKRTDYIGDKYRFDTIVMRAFYYLNMPDEAIKFFEDEMLSQLFSQVTGYQILLDLLFENEKYVDVLRIYEDLKKYGRLHSNKYIDVIIFATYYRMNTPEALEHATDLWNKITENRNYVQFRKSRTFFAGLAVKQNQPELALKILEGETTYVTMRHIKLLAWAQLGKFDEICNMLRMVQKKHEENEKYKPMTSQEVLMELEKLVRSRGSEKDIDNFNVIHKQVESLQLITDKTLDDLLCAPFPILPQANIYHKKK